MNKALDYIALSLSVLIVWLLGLTWCCVKVEAESGRFVTLHSLPCVFGGRCQL